MHRLAASLPSPSPDWALFLDFDGTLVELAAAPSAVRIPAELPGILDRLRQGLGGAVALVSGRKLGDLDRYLGALALPAAGQHGAEMRGDDGVVRALVAENLISPLAPAIGAFAAARPGLVVEDKGMSIALHYRQAPEHRDAAGAFMKRLAADHDGGLETIAGHCVFEIKARAMNKGNAVIRFLEDKPFKGRIPVFVGDDTTDEDGFRVALGLGGAAIRVGLTGPSLAQARIADPAEARRWLSFIGDELAAGDARRRPYAGP
jgi:trehalose 6-phosphate phosphatase